MRLTWKDAAATMLVAAILVPYFGYLARGSMPFIHDARGMAAAALIIGAVTCYAGDRRVMARRWTVLTAVTALLGAAALGLGIAAIVTASGGVLAALIACIVALWALTTARHAAGTLSRATTPPARPVHH
jgi:hypothetical protein